MSCKICGGELAELGSLGKLTHFRCRQCGMESSTEKGDDNSSGFGVGLAVNGDSEGDDEEGRDEGS
jgi:hypothetical protein